MILSSKVLRKLGGIWPPFFFVVLALNLSGCSNLLNRWLCGRVSVMEYFRKQTNYHKEKGYYATDLYPLKLDPPEECREDWRYSIKTAEDRQSYVVRSLNVKTGESYEVNQIGIMEERKDK